MKNPKRLMMIIINDTKSKKIIVEAEDREEALKKLRLGQVKEYPPTTKYTLEIISAPTWAYSDQEKDDEE